jgi:hypothetical protein
VIKRADPLRTLLLPYHDGLSGHLMGSLNDRIAFFRREKARRSNVGAQEVLHEVGRAVVGGGGSATVGSQCWISSSRIWALTDRARSTPIRPPSQPAGLPSRRRWCSVPFRAAFELAE